MKRQKVLLALTVLWLAVSCDLTGSKSSTDAQSSDFDAALDAALHPTAGVGAKRILFHRGQTFLLSQTTWVDVAGPVVIGAFGSGPRPTVKADNGSWGSATCIAVGVGYSGTKVRVVDCQSSNIVGGGEYCFRYQGGQYGVIAHNTDNYSASTPNARLSSTPTLAVVPPTSDPKDWKLAAGSYGLGAGTAVPVWSDFHGTPLTAGSTRNLGALAE